MNSIRKIINAILACLIMIPVLSASADVFTFQNGVNVGEQMYTGTVDLYPRSDTTSANGTHNGYNTMYIRAGVNSNIEALVRWDGIKNHLPVGFVVQSARIGLTIQSPVHEVTIGVTQMLKPWTGPGGYWMADGYGNSWAAPGAQGIVANGSIPADRSAVVMDILTVPGDAEPGDVLWFDITPAIVQSWIDNPNTNCGVLFYGPDNSQEMLQVNLSGVTEGLINGVNQRPMLEITGVVVPPVTGSVFTFQYGTNVGGQRYEGCVDLYPRSDTTFANGTHNSYNSMYLRAGVIANMESLVRWDGIENYLPTGFAVQSARIGLTIQSPVHEISLGVTQMLKPWTGPGGYWMEDGYGNLWAAPGAQGIVANGSIPADRSAVVMDTLTVSGSAAPGDVLWFDITPAVVQGWIDNPSSNYGVLFYGTDNSQEMWMVVISGVTEGLINGVNQRPMLEITAMPSCSDVAKAGRGIQADLNYDCYVDLADFSVLANYWMRCYEPGDPDCSMEETISEPIDYYIPVGQPTVDGDLADWATATWVAMDRSYHDIMYHGDPYDLTNAKWAAKWNPVTNLIYVAATGDDSEHVLKTAYEDGTANDMLEVFLDSTNSDLTDYNIDYALAQHYLCASNGLGGEWIVLGGSTPPAGAVAAFKARVVGNTYMYEMALRPYANLVNSIELTLGSGDIVGLDVVMGTRTISVLDNFGRKGHDISAGKYSHSGEFMNCQLLSQ